MQEVDKIIRAWKDEDYRSSLSFELLERNRHLNLNDCVLGHKNRPLLTSTLTLHN
jgi:hypothetical protein